MDGYELPSEIKDAGKKANSLASVAGNYAANQGTVADALKKKALEAYTENADIISKLDTATSDYYSAPSTARDKFQNIFNPFQREALVSQYTNNQAVPMLSYAGMYGQRMGRIDDVIGAGTNAYSAEVAARQNAADAAQRAYSNMLQEYSLEEDRRRWEEEMAYNKSSSSGGGPDLTSLVAAILAGQGNNGKGNEGGGGDMPDISDEAKYSVEGSMNFLGNAVKELVPNSVKDIGKSLWQVQPFNVPGQINFAGSLINQILGKGKK